MSRFIRRAIVFALPFVAYALAVVLVDPFEYFRFGGTFVPHAEKERIAGRIHYTLWRSRQFERHPASRILLGDSRLGKLAPGEIEKVNGKRYFNFAFGGGTIPELEAAYELASRRVHLEEIVLGVSFLNMAASQNMNRFVESNAIEANPALYLVDRNVAAATGVLLWGSLFSRARDVELPRMSRDEFWRYQLDEGAARAFEGFVYAEEWERKLEKIVQSCRKSGTDVLFVIPPSHVDLQAKVVEYGLAAEQERFKRFARRLAPTIDLDIESDLTRDAARFGDPFHPLRGDEIIGEVWGSERRFGIHSEPEDEAR